MHMAECIDRRQMKAKSASLLRNAQVGSRRFFALYLFLIVVIDIVAALADSSVGNRGSSSTLFSNPVDVFTTVLSMLVSLILGVGCYLYCFGIWRNERMEFLTLFDGFSFAGKIILLSLVKFIFVLLWTCLLIIPGIIALYSYRFAILDLCENPSMGVLQAINMSKQQTNGYKTQLFMLDLSYIGWILLANLPVIYFNCVAMASVQGVTLWGAGLNGLIQTLVAEAFYFPVNLIYLPHYEMTVLGYFKTAKGTSGIGKGITPSDPGEDSNHVV